jgi:glc operon protein GlcG
VQPISTQLPPEYGLSISLDMAKRVMAAAEADAVAKQWPMVIAIVDTGGNLVMLHKLDQAQIGSVLVAQLKAETAAKFRRPTKAFEDTVANGGNGLRVLSMANVCAVEGGLPLMLQGKVIGAIGVSGMHSSQDGEVAAAGAKVLLG